MLAFLSGYRTYIAAFLIAAVTFCESMGWLSPEQARTLEGILMAIVAATLRAAISAEAKG